MIPSTALAVALGTIKLGSTHGPWSRAVGFRYVLNPPFGLKGPSQPLWGGAAKAIGARFTPRGSFESIYLSEDPITAFIEVFALLILPDGPMPVRSAPWVILSVDGMLSNLLDLTDVATLAALQTTEQEMTGTWIKASNPPTQVLAQAAYDSGRIVGIKYGSAKHAGGLNLVVFLDRISVSPGNFLEVYDPHGNLTQRIRSGETNPWPSAYREEKPIPETKKSRDTDRSLVSEKSWEVEIVHKHFPKRTHQEVKTALDAAKRELKGSESTKKIMEILKKKLE